jgi:hypothetical protein
MQRLIFFVLCCILFFSVGNGYCETELFGDTLYSVERPQVQEIPSEYWGSHVKMLFNTDRHGEVLTIQAFHQVYGRPFQRFGFRWLNGSTLEMDWSRIHQIFAILSGLDLCHGHLSLAPRYGWGAITGVENSIDEIVAGFKKKFPSVKKLQFEIWPAKKLVFKDQFPPYDLPYEQKKISKWKNALKKNAIQIDQLDEIEESVFPLE